MWRDTNSLLCLSFKFNGGEIRVSGFAVLLVSGFWEKIALRPAIPGYSTAIEYKPQIEHRIWRVSKGIEVLKRDFLAPLSYKFQYKCSNVLYIRMYVFT